MSDFFKAIPVVLKEEGGYVFDKDDPGGETKFGISKRTYPGVDIQDLTVTGAMAIYHSDFWNKYHYSDINDQDLATKVLDCAVNMGPHASHCLLQMALGIHVDGVLGPVTFDRANSADPQATLESIRHLQVEHYRQLIAKKPMLAKFQEGWEKRAEEV